MAKSVLCAVAAALVLACAGPLKNQPVCPESKNVRCLTGLDCEYDEKRACEVCRCKEPAYTPIDK